MIQLRNKYKIGTFFRKEKQVVDCFLKNYY